MNITERDATSFKPKVAENVRRQSQVRTTIAKETPTEQFIEPRRFNLDEFEYERAGTDPGRIVIFNQEIFGNLKICNDATGKVEDHRLETRSGSRQDVIAIINTFQRMGFNIRANDVLSNGTVEDVLAKLDEVLRDKESLAETNSLFIFFLTHGLAGDELYARDGILQCRKIWTKFIDCNELKGKPKMFIFQACKGDYYAKIDDHPSFNSDPSTLVHLNTFKPKHVGMDMLIFFATIEGNESYRNPLEGTWLIQELCRNLSSYGRRDDMISICMRTTKCVTGNYYHQEEGEILKQMPVLITTLSKKFYVNRNKERHLLLEVLKEQKETKDLLVQLVALLQPHV
ncbi:caspase-7 [Dendroctonus ponderosae]|uniref:caspase-7 n=1 Tax=Dendroctonus ponderosae TaxID=77166 RepID=UPI0020357C20|nr:caspase-7 [Dendroctonus ponderosae]